MKNKSIESSSGVSFRNKLSTIFCLIFGISLVIGSVWLMWDSMENNYTDKLPNTIPIVTIAGLLLAMLSPIFITKPSELSRVKIYKGVQTEEC